MCVRCMCSCILFLKSWHWELVYEEPRLRFDTNNDTKQDAFEELAAELILKIIW